MRRWLYRSHIWIGVAVALPLLAWATSGLVSLWPSTGAGGLRVEPIDAGKVHVLPVEALRQADLLAGRHLPITAMTLLMRDGRPVYQAIGGLGAGSILIDAETGAARMAPPPKPAARYFSQAHFFYFAGPAQVPLMAAGCVLACAAALTGLVLAARKLWRLRARG